MSAFRGVARLTALALLASCAAPPEQRAGNAELAALCDADQADREGDWSGRSQEELLATVERDRSRRARVLELVHSGALATPADHYHAALVLQHGDAPEDFLLAHVLATAAALDGYPGAAWLSAAALDRFLHHLERPQVFGTQYERSGSGPWTMEPFDRSWPAALLQRFHVPPVVESERRLETLNAAPEHAHGPSAPR